jgi:hypothetical protein
MIELTMIVKIYLIDKKILLYISHEIDHSLIMNKVCQKRMDIQDYIASLRHINHVGQEFLKHYFVFHMNLLENPLEEVDWPYAE